MNDTQELTYEEIQQPDEPQEGPHEVITMAPPEAGFSLNWQMFDANGGNVQVTMRAATAEEWPSVIRQRAAFIEKATKGGWSFPGKPVSALAITGPATTPTQAAVATGKAVPPVQAGGNGHSNGELTFAADTLTITVDGGKTYFKVKGGKFQKFGVTIWPEALAAAGFDPDALNPRETYSLAGFTAHYIEKDGKPNKVTQLTK